MGLPDVIIILKSEDFFSNVQDTMDDVFYWLGLSPFTLTSRKRWQEAHYAPLPSQTRAHLLRYFQPHNARWAELTGMKWE